MSAYNVDFYMILKYNASEKEVATMFSIASIVAAFTTLGIMNFVKKEAKTLHIATVALQALLFIGMAIAPAIWLFIILFSLRDAIGILTDSTLESILLDSSKAKGLLISTIQISWEVFTGFGKFLGSILASTNPDLPLFVASMILLIYTVIFAVISEERLRSQKDHPK